MIADVHLFYYSQRLTSESELVSFYVYLGHCDPTKPIQEKVC